MALQTPSQAYGLGEVPACLQDLPGRELDLATCEDPGLAGIGAVFVFTQGTAVGALVQEIAIQDVWWRVAPLIGTTRIHGGKAFEAVHGVDPFFANPRRPALGYGLKDVYGMSKGKPWQRQTLCWSPMHKDNQS